MPRVIDQDQPGHLIRLLFACFRDPLLSRTIGRYEHFVPACCRYLTPQDSRGLCGDIRRLPRRTRTGTNGGQRSLSLEPGRRRRPAPTRICSPASSVRAGNVCTNALLIQPTNVWQCAAASMGRWYSHRAGGGRRLWTDPPIFLRQFR